MLKHLQTSDQWDEKNLAEKGLTLIELLVVIVILGILAGVVVFAIGNVKDKASENACVNELDTVEVAIEAYALANDIPTTDVTLADLTTGTNAQLKKNPKYWTVPAGKPVRDTATYSDISLANCPNPA